MTRRDGRYFSAHGVIPHGASLQTCPQGHSTCWPRTCPVCRAMALAYQGRVPLAPEVKIVTMGNRSWVVPARKVA